MAVTQPTFAPFIQTSSNAQADDATYAWVVGWLVFIALLAVLAQSEAGYSVVYYTLVLILVLLLVTQYKAIVAVLRPVGSDIPTQ